MSLKSDKPPSNTNTENLLSYKQNYEIIKDTNNMPKVELSKAMRYSIYILFSFINIVVNMDSGNIPAATDKIREDLKINNKEIGLFSSLISSGTFIGGIISFSIINVLSRKWTLIISNIGIVACLFTFPMTNNVGLLFTNRVVCGIFMVVFL